MADEFNVTSNDQRGGLTVGNVNVNYGNQSFGQEPKPGGSNKPNWKSIVKWGAIILGAVASIIAILTYFEILPFRKSPGRQEVNANYKDTIKTVFNNPNLKTVDSSFSKNKKPQAKKIQPMENDKKGDTYNVQSNNQSGGVTAGRIDKIEIIVKNEAEANVSFPDNYLVSFDSVANEYRVQPKAGKWSKPFIWIPLEEKERVKPSFSGEGAMLFNVSEGEFTINDHKYFGMTIGLFGAGTPATRDFYYSARFESLPTHFVFGDYGKLVYNVALKR